MEALRSFARLSAGPLALVAFFLPWVHGEGILRYESYSGFDLVRIATILAQLDLAPDQRMALFAARCLLIAVPVAAIWRTLLAPAHSWHWGYRVAGVYLVISGVGLAGVGLVRSGGFAPPPGLAMMFCSALAIVATSIRFSSHPVTKAASLDSSPY